MRNLITIALVSLLFIGCNSSHVIPDTSELVIEHGEVMDTALHQGTAGARLTSILLTSNSRRSLEFIGVPLNLRGVLSENLSDSLTDLRLVRESDGVELTARYQSGIGYVEEITFDEPITLAPGESLLLILVADIPVGASNRIDIEFGAPSTVGGRSMFPAIAYADTGDWVPDELVQGNVAQNAHIIIAE
jgi:hypothetical protein